MREFQEPTNDTGDAQWYSKEKIKKLEYYNIKRRSQCPIPFQGGKGESNCEKLTVRKPII